MVCGVGKNGAASKAVYGFTALLYSIRLYGLLKGWPTWDDRFSQYGIGGSGTLKIVIYVENYPQKRCFRLSDYHPLWGCGVLISGHNMYTYNICVCRG